MARVIVAMSGGVDSSVAAWLLRQQGYEVIGVFMRHGVETPESDSYSGGQPGSAACAAATRCDVTAEFQASSVTRTKALKQCCSAGDAADARRVADRLGIPLYVLNFQEQFGRIVQYFVDEYAAGRTPNPCIMCNTWLKFGKLFEYADALGAEFVATGHYARLLPCSDGQLGLFRAADPQKDQSYVLFGVRRQLLPRLKFLLGHLSKAEVRQIADRLGLCVARKPDSQEICFAPQGNHWRLVRERLPGLDTSGEIVSTDGRVLGRHDGLERFTIGQRKGLKIAVGRRQYVVRLEPHTKRVVIGDREELARNHLTASHVNWLITPPTGEFPAMVKIRYRSPALQAVVEPLGQHRIAVRFLEPCYAVTPGQAVVCYQQDRVVGGGWID